MYGIVPIGLGGYSLPDKLPSQCGASAGILDWLLQEMRGEEDVCRGGFALKWLCISNTRLKVAIFIRVLHHTSRHEVSAKNFHFTTPPWGLLRWAVSLCGLDDDAGSHRTSDAGG
jgi:hypothetical protein